MKDDFINEGEKIAGNYKLAICSIVRDCSKNLKNNIEVIEKIRSYFKSSVVIVFENDSLDGTKEVLDEWRKNCKECYIESVDFLQQTVPPYGSNGVNRYFSKYRISKLINYRNKYLDKLEEINFNPDFVMVVDLDVSKIYKNGVFHSFSVVDQWDVVCANGISTSPKLQKRYHDSYALVELGKESLSQTEESIKENATKWKFLKEGLPLIPVFSAFGGLSIYRYEAIKSLRYRLSQNKDKKVQVRCEHYTLCTDIRARGFNKIFINPHMKVKCQSVNYQLVKKFFYNHLMKLKYRT